MLNSCSQRPEICLKLPKSYDTIFGQTSNLDVFFRASTKGRASLLYNSRLKKVYLRPSVPLEGEISSEDFMDKFASRLYQDEKRFDWEARWSRNGRDPGFRRYEDYFPDFSVMANFIGSESFLGYKEVKGEGKDEEEGGRDAKIRLDSQKSNMSMKKNEQKIGSKNSLFYWRIEYFNISLDRAGKYPSSFGVYDVLKKFDFQARKFESGIIIRYQKAHKESQIALNYPQISPECDDFAGFVKLSKSQNLSFLRPSHQTPYCEGFKYSIRIGPGDLIRKYDLRNGELLEKANLSKIVDLGQKNYPKFENPRGRSGKTVVGVAQERMKSLKILNREFLVFLNGCGFWVILISLEPLRVVDCAKMDFYVSSLDALLEIRKNFEFEQFGHQEAKLGFLGNKGGFESRIDPNNANEKPVKVGLRLVFQILGY